MHLSINSERLYCWEGKGDIVRGHQEMTNLFTGVVSNRYQESIVGGKNQQNNVFGHSYKFYGIRRCYEVHLQKVSIISSRSAVQKVGILSECEWRNTGLWGP